MGLFQVVKDIIARLVGVLKRYRCMDSWAPAWKYKVYLTPSSRLVIVVLLGMVALHACYVSYCLDSSSSARVRYGRGYSARNNTGVVANPICAILLVMMMIFFDALSKESPQIPSYCFHPETR